MFCHHYDIRRTPKTHVSRHGIALQAFSHAQETSPTPTAAACSRVASALCCSHVKGTSSITGPRQVPGDRGDGLLGSISSLMQLPAARQDTG